MTGAQAVLQFLRRHRTICIDTAVLIYWVEDHPKYAPFLQPLFSWLDRESGRAVTSTVSLLEILVKPYRESNIDLVNRFYALLVSHPGLQWIDLTLPIADRAANIRAEHNLRTPDAIQAATALHSGATGLIGNDSVFERLTDLEILTLERIS